MSTYIHVELIPTTSVAAAVTTTGEVDKPGHSRYIFVTEVASIASGNITTTIEHSPDGATWYTVHAFSAQTGAGQLMHQHNGQATPLFSLIRARAVKTGASAATFKVYMRVG
jgi:hypothetical protein